MSCTIHFISKTIPGYGTSDAIYPSRPNSSRVGDGTLISNVKILSSRCPLRPSSICNVSNRYHPSNSDFFEPNKKRFLHNKTLPNEELKDRDEDFEESGKRKFVATKMPGPTEKKVVELFDKILARLREKSAVNEGKGKVDNSHGKSKESETADSLLKDLRKHSVEQGNKIDSIGIANARGQPERVDSFTEESVTAKPKMQESPTPKASRPKSNFFRKSPVPKVKSGPAHSGLDVETDDMKTLPSEANMFVEMPEHENGEDEQNRVEVSDVSLMKLVELRALAKSRGVKGFSKLKKTELIELLRGSSI